MSPEVFFELFLEELKMRPEMHSYYKFLEGGKSFGFRKNYFLERLRYIAAKVRQGESVWDCGSGYGTTCFFLAMNGIAAHGTTLEFYFDVVSKRYDFWNKHGNANLFTCSYENLFDNPPKPESYDTIIVQDTLHHLEPIDEALKIFQKVLKPNGKLIAIEENGNNIIQTLKLYKQRGNKRIITIRDEKLNKDILIGNENIRSLSEWKRLFAKCGFEITDASVQYIRFFLPFQYDEHNADNLLHRERNIAAKSKWRKEYLFFGVNFLAEKK